MAKEPKKPARRRWRWSSITPDTSMEWFNEQRTEGEEDTVMPSVLRNIAARRSGPVRRGCDMTPEELQAHAQRLGMTVALVHGPVAPPRCVHYELTQHACRAAADPGYTTCPDHRMSSRKA